MNFSLLTDWAFKIPYELGSYLDLHWKNDARIAIIAVALLSHTYTLILETFILK